MGISLWFTKSAKSTDRPNTECVELIEKNEREQSDTETAQASCVLHYMVKPIQYTCHQFVFQISHNSEVMKHLRILRVSSFQVEAFECKVCSLTHKIFIKA